MPNESGAFDLKPSPPLTEAQQERLTAMADEHGESGGEEVTVDAVTAFVVIMLKGGEVLVAPAGTNVRMEREATNHDVFGASSVVIKDVQVAEIAQTTAMTMMAQAQAQMEQARSNQIASQLQQSGNLRG